MGAAPLIQLKSVTSASRRNSSSLLPSTTSFVFGQISQNVQRRGRRDAEPLALADGVVYHTLVHSKTLPELSTKFPHTGLRPVCLSITPA